MLFCKSNRNKVGMYDVSINRRIIREINTSTFFYSEIEKCALSKKNVIMVCGVDQIP